jgi:PAS domain S-box-containing protein
MNANWREAAVPAAATIEPTDWALHALELHPVAHTVLAADGSVQWLNLASARLLDCSPAAAIGMHWERVKPCYAGKLDLSSGTVPPRHTWLRRDGRVGHFTSQLTALADGRFLLIEADVSDVVRGHDEEQDRLQRLNGLVAGSPDCILILDASGGLLASSDAAVDLLGIERGAGQPRNILELIHADELPAIRQRLASGAVAHSPARFEQAICRCRNAAGAWQWISAVMINALTVPSIEAVIVYVRDATRQVELERELRRRERRFAALTENSDDMIVVIGNDGRLNFESASISRILGYRAKQLTTLRLLRLLHKTSRPRVLGMVRALMRNRGGELTIECLVRGYDGHYRWIEAVCVNLLDDPDIAGILCNARDITARKGAELERDTAVVCGGIALWNYDVGYRTAHWIGAGMPQLFGTVDGFFTEENYFAYIHPDDREIVRKSYDVVERGLANDVQVQFRTRDKDGDWRWIIERGQSAGFNPVTGARLVAGVSIDITEQRATEDQLTVARDQFKFAMESSQTGFYDWDVVNDTASGMDDWCTRHRLPLEGKPGHFARWETYIHAEDWPDAQRRFDAHLRGETEYADMEYRLRCGDGCLIWIMDRARVVERGPNGEPLHVVGLLVNIEERKRIEQALLASEARLSMAIWGGSFGLWEMDVATQRTRWLSDWCEREDLEPCEADHVNSWDSHIHPDDLPDAAAAFTRMVQGENDSFESEYRVRTRAGAWTWVLERSRAVARNSSGQPSKVSGICININKRKAFEENLRKSEARYRSVASLTPGFVAEVALSGDQLPRLTWASEGFTEVFGRPFAEFADTANLRALFADLADWRTATERFRLVASGTQVDFEVKVRQHDGQIRWIYLIARPLADSSGHYTTAIVVAHDISKRKAAETALHEAQQSMQIIAANSPDWLFLLDQDGLVRYANRPMGRVTVEQMIGRPVAALTEANNQSRREIAEALASTLAGQEVSLQQTIVAPSTGMRHVLLHRTRPVNDHGVTVGALVITSDITEQQQREELLRLQGLVLETIHEGVVLLDARNQVTLSNPAFDRMCGASVGQLTGMRIESLLLLPPARLRATKTVLESSVRRLDGSQFSAAAVVTPMQINGEPHLLLVISDVTERILLEREILEVSSREQQRIGNDLHDGLGQELTGVALMLRALAGRIRKEHPQANIDMNETIALVNHSIESTRALARGLSPVSIEGGGLLPALQTLIARARSAYGVNIQMRRLIRRPLQIRPDAATHLYRIVQEGLTNAVRHGRASRLTLTVISTTSHIDVSVRDNGRGIAATSSRSAGIGLKTMSYRAEMLGGELSILPAPGGGTIVKCRCPQNPGEAGDAASSGKNRLQITRILPGS